GSRALALTWSAGHWPASADVRPKAITTPARTAVRPTARPLMMRSNMIDLSSVDGSAGLEAAPARRISRRAPQWKCRVALKSIAGCYASSVSGIDHGRGLALPRPSAFDLQHQRPAQEGAHQHQAGEQCQALKIQFECDGLDDIGSDQHFEPEQQRAAD